MSELSDFIDNLKDDEVGVIFTPKDRPNDIGATTFSFDEMCKLTGDDTQSFFLSLAIRPGWSFFVRHLELIHFPPLSEKNEKLIVFHFKWKDMPFSMVSIPKEFHSDAVDSAEKTQMKLVDGALPTTNDPLTGKWVSLPFQAKNVTTLENAAGSSLYKMGTDQAHKWESEQIQKLEQSVGL